MLWQKCDSIVGNDLSFMLTILLVAPFQLLLSVMMFMPEIQQKGFTVPPFPTILPYAVPAVLYCLNNNILVHMQLHMDPATYQVGHFWGSRGT